MKYLYKKILILFSIFISSWFVSWADQFDCDFLIDWKIPAIDNAFDSVKTYLFKKEDMQTAINNLTAYCCEQEKLSKKYCQNKNFKKIYPQSLYLLDHIADIWFRKIDWDPSVLYWLEPFSPWKSRRDYIQKIWNSSEWVNPKLITLEFNNKWKLWDALVSDTVNCDNYEWQDNAWLAQNYYDMCAETYCIYKELYKVESDFDKSTFVSVCNQRASERIRDEVKYIQMTIFQKSSKIIWDILNSYLWDYFSKSRSINFIEIVHQMTDDFGSVVQKVSEWTKMCTK